MTEKRNRAAVELGRRRFKDKDEARTLGRLGADARWAPPTKRDRFIRGAVKIRFARTVIEAVDSLFDWLKQGGQRRALVIHQGTAWVVDPTTKDFRIQEQKYPGSIIGIYNRNASRLQVIEDIKETMPALASVLG